MTLAVVGTALAWLAAAGGVTLAAWHFLRRSPPRWLLRGHPLAGMTALALMWAVFALWQGPRDLPLDAGTIVLTFAFAAGAFMFSLRTTRLPVPGLAIVLHGIGALTGAALLIVGLLHFPAG